LPLRADRVLNRVREARGGKLYDSRFGIRAAAMGNTQTRPARCRGDVKR